MGTGHVMRCLTLAQGLKGFDVASRFVCREHTGALCDVIEQRGFAVARLPSAATPTWQFDGPGYAAWLGEDWRIDAQQTRAAMIEQNDLQGAATEWLIVDHYGIDRRWEQEMRTATRRIMTIDDLADRAHDCDVLLDQNLVEHMELRYLDKVPSATTTLLGPGYALLQPVYGELRQQVRPRSGVPRRVLISFGGVDHDNLTGRALAAFLQLGRADIAADVVITGSMAHAASIREQAAQHNNVHLHSGLPTLAHLIAAADLAVGAAGITSWERLCLGLPSLVVTLADNQRPPAERLHREGLIRWLGQGSEVDQSMLFEALDELSLHGLDEQWSRRCLDAVDGKGLQRVCASLMMTADTPLQLRLASVADERQLLAWANEPVTRRNAFATDTINAATHGEWFSRRLNSPHSCRIFIAETHAAVPVGQVRFDRAQESWLISYSLDAAFRGRGVGRQLLQSALAKFTVEQPGSVVTGQVKTANRPSCRIFERLGFRVIADDGEVVEYRRAL